MAHISEAAPLQISRFYTGLYTYRNPLIVPIRQYGRRIVELYDAISDGLNMEPSNRYTLVRRPGYTPVNSNAVDGTPLLFYTFKPVNFPEQLYTIVDTTTQVQWMNPGNDPPVTLVTKTTPALTTFAQVAAYLYMANENFAEKWDSPTGAQGVTRWGISAAGIDQRVASAPATAVNIPLKIPAPAWTISGSGGTVTLNRAASSATAGPSPASSWEGRWQHMQNTAVLDGNLATVNVECGQNTPVFAAQGFDFNIPVTAVIQGITVRVVAQPIWPSVSEDYLLFNLRLRKAGAAVGEQKGSMEPLDALIDATYGSDEDLWQTAWTPSDLNNPQFGIELQFKNVDDHQITLGVDFVSVQVDYLIPSTTGTLVSQFLQDSGFTFALADPGTTGTGLPLATDTITGIEVGVTGLETQGDGIMLSARLVKNGTQTGPSKTLHLPANSQTVVLGNPGDTWGVDLVPSDLISQGGFGVAFQAINSSSISATYTIQSVDMTVFFSSGPIVAPDNGALPAGAQPLNTQVGYQYVQCFGNAYSGHISSPSPPSIYGTPATNINYPLLYTDPPGSLAAAQITVVGSDDPQVTDVHIFRTTDGGGEPFYELPNSPIPNPGAATATIVDFAQDWELQIANIAPTPHFNDPPPEGAVDPVWFSGRLWMHKGNLLFFASGPDITMGNEQEAWFPAYVFEIPGAEIIRKFPLPGGMLVVTVDEIYIVRGTSTASFIVSDFVKDTGMRTWTAADSDGTNVYVYSSDRQFLLINANGLNPANQNIADTIQVVDPRLAHVVQWRFGANQSWVFVGDGSTFIYPFNPDLNAWATIQAPVGGVRAMGNVETMPGVFQFWRARPVDGSLITFRDVTSFRDEGWAYPCHATFGPITVADFLTLAQLRDIALVTARTSSVVNVSVLPNEVLPIRAKQFQLLTRSSSEPPELSGDNESLSFRADRYSWKSCPYPELVNFAFLRIDFSADANPDELWNWTIGGTQTTGGSSLGQPGQLPQLQGR